MAPAFRTARMSAIVISSGVSKASIKTCSLRLSLVEYLLIRSLERHLAINLRALDLHERNGACLPHSANERDCHLIRRIEGLDQNVLIAFKSRRVLAKKCREFFKTGVVHRTL